MDLTHIAFIMDGNRRYSKKQFLTLEEGYAKGMEKFLEIVYFQVKYKIKETSFFALSNDNLNKRDKSEKEILFKLIKSFSKNEKIKEFFKTHKIKINIKGNLKELEKKSKNKKDKFVEELKKEFELWNKENKKPAFLVNIALNYDGQQEILHSFKEILKLFKEGKIKENNITTKTIKKNLWFNDTTQPQIIVRTGNAPRLSGFMLWDSEYSEIYLTKKLWPELNESDFLVIIDWYKNIQRNFGK